MSDSYHLGYDHYTRCESHRVDNHTSFCSSLDLTPSFCRHCGLAYTPSTGFLLRPDCVDGICTPLATHSVMFHNMIAKQRTHIPLSSEHISHALRLIAVRQLYSLSCSLGFQKITFIRAVTLLDKFLSIAPLNPNHYNMVSMVVLNLACKFGEQWPKNLTLTKICELLKGTYELQEIAMWEIHIMSVLGWNADVKTAHDFAHFFLWQGMVTMQDVDSRGGPDSLRADSLLDCLYLLVVQILDMALIDFGFYHYTPSALAASAIAVARELLGLKVWHSTLTLTTTFTLEMINGCLKVVRQLVTQPTNLAKVRYLLRKYHVDLPITFFGSAILQTLTALTPNSIDLLPPINYENQNVLNSNTISNTSLTSSSNHDDSSSKDTSLPKLSKDRKKRISRNRDRHTITPTGSDVAVTRVTSKGIATTKIRVSILDTQTSIIAAKEVKRKC